MLTDKDPHELRPVLELLKSTEGELAELVSKARQPGYYNPAVPYIGLEQHAASLSSYTPHYFSALDQDSKFMLLQFDGPGLRLVVHIEGPAGYQLHTNKQIADRQREEAERLNNATLNFSDSVELVVRERDSYCDD